MLCQKLDSSKRSCLMHPYFPVVFRFLYHRLSKKSLRTHILSKDDCFMALTTSLNPKYIPYFGASASPNHPVGASSNLASQVILYVPTRLLSNPPQALTLTLPFASAILSSDSQSPLLKFHHRPLKYASSHTQENEVLTYAQTPTSHPNSPHQISEQHTHNSADHKAAARQYQQVELCPLSWFPGNGM